MIGLTRRPTTAAINQERLKLLERLEVASQAPPSLESILEAFFGPAVRALAENHRGPLLAKMMSRIYWESGGETRQLILGQFREVFEAADLILAKGQASFETLADDEKTVYFLFRVKCEVMARAQGAEIGDLVFSRP